MRYGIPPETPPEPMIRVLMQRTSKATLDGGGTTRVFEEGHEYDLPEWLAEAFFRGGEADPAEAHAQHSADAQEGPGEAGDGEGPQVGSKTANARPRSSTARRKA